MPKRKQAPGVYDWYTRPDLRLMSMLLGGFAVRCPDDNTLVTLGTVPGHGVCPCCGRFFRVAVRIDTALPPPIPEVAP